VLLTLDLSSVVGWAAGPAGAQPLSGTWKLQPHLGLGVAFLGLKNELEDAINMMHPTLVAFEAPLFVQDDFTRLAFGLAAQVESVCADCGLPPALPVSVSKARSFVLGRTGWGGTTREARRAAIKAAVLTWAREQGYAPVDDNAADALVLWRFVADGGHLGRKRAA
jgi:hypothetical protein